MLLFQEWSDGGGQGECKKMEIGCSEVNVMVQDCRYDEQSFFFFMTRKGIEIFYRLESPEKPT